MWVFQPLWTSVQTSNEPLSILTSLEAFADTWGPIWEVPASEFFSNYIKQINVATGFIRRNGDQSDSPIKGAVPCHWFHSPGTVPLQHPGDYRRDPIQRGDKLLIGGLDDSTLKVREQCSFTLDDLERYFGHYMTPLGTKPSVWSTSERQVGFSVSQYVGITVTGTQKGCLVQHRNRQSGTNGSSNQGEPILIS